MARNGINMHGVHVVVIVLLLGLSWAQDIADEIAAHQGDVDRIIDYVLNGAGRHGFYDQLAVYSDDHGPRLSGSQDLEQAIDYTIQELQNEGFTNVHGEDVTVPSWTRGEAQAEMIQPRPHVVQLMALGTSIGTPPAGITAEVIVVRSFEELEERKAEVPGKIVVYNQPWTEYGESVEYRANGATEASRRGAVAALVRSVTGYSLHTVHIGHQIYGDGVNPIPVACITVEDAELMQRLHNRNKTIEISMTMTCENNQDITSRNVVADYVGHTYPNEYVIIGGHIDTWDVGFGPMDDGGGVIMSWQVVRILKALGLQPKRTIRLVFWTGEEWGLIGGDKYFEDHKADNSSISLIMESDAGTFNPLGIGFTGSGLARYQMEEIGRLLTAIDTTWVGPDGSHPDIGKWLDIGVPAGNLQNDRTTYFHYHHSPADTMTMEDPATLDRCAILWTAVTYVVANLEEKLPRTGDYPSTGLAAPGPAAPGTVGLVGAASGALLVSRLVGRRRV